MPSPAPPATSYRSRSPGSARRLRPGLATASGRMRSRDPPCRTWPLPVRSGQHAGVTRIGVEQQRVALRDDLRARPAFVVAQSSLLRRRQSRHARTAGTGQSTCTHGVRQAPRFDSSGVLVSAGCSSLIRPRRWRETSPSSWIRKRSRHGLRVLHRPGCSQRGEGPRCAPLARCETGVVYGAETCIRVGACTRSQQGSP